MAEQFTIQSGEMLKKDLKLGTIAAITLTYLHLRNLLLMLKRKIVSSVLIICFVLFLPQCLQLIIIITSVVTFIQCLTLLCRSVRLPYCILLYEKSYSEAIKNEQNDLTQKCTNGHNCTNAMESRDIETLFIHGVSNMLFMLTFKYRYNRFCS